MTGGRALLSLLFLITASPCVAGVLVVNELYYDHPGADAGYEFIEVLNTSGESIALDGLVIEFHNGSGIGWVVLWSAGPGLALEPDRPFVVGGSAVMPPPDVVFDFSLQNGPDAIRVVTGDGTVTDVVGYGGLDDGEYTEVAGAGPVSAGQSIARIPDGADTDNNAADFSAAGPTPARFNLARHDLSIRLGPDTPARAARGAAETERLHFELVNAGQVRAAAGAVAICLTDSAVAGVVDLDCASNVGDIEPGSAEPIAVAVRFETGYHWIRARVVYALDERSGNDEITLVRRAGGIAVLVSEVWSSPRDGCPQFVELFNAGSVPVDVGGWSLRDARARPVAFATASRVLAPHGFVAITSSPSALHACTPSAGIEHMLGVDGSWPSFNRAGSGGVADSVVVYDAHEIPVDAVAYPPLPATSSGLSLERVDLYAGTTMPVWRVCASPAGSTPGLPNAASLYDPPEPGAIDASPNPFAPAKGDVLRIAVAAGASVVRVAVHVFDATGRRVAEVGASDALPAVFLWDGRDADGQVVAPGLYVLACEEFLADGRRGAVLKAVVGCAPAAP